MSLKKIADPRALQFWDRQRLISHTLGEHDRRSIVWDHVAVYPPGAVWNQTPPQPLYEGGPVVRVAGPLLKSLDRALGEH